MVKLSEIMQEADRIQANFDKMTSKQKKLFLKELHDNYGWEPEYQGKSLNDFAKTRIDTKYIKEHEQK